MRSTLTPKRSIIAGGDLHWPVRRDLRSVTVMASPSAVSGSEEQQGGEELGGQAGCPGADVPALDPVGADGERVAAFLDLVDEKSTPRLRSALVSGPRGRRRIWAEASKWNSPWPAAASAGRNLEVVAPSRQNTAGLREPASGPPPSSRHRPGARSTARSPERGEAIGEAAWVSSKSSGLRRAAVVPRAAAARNSARAVMDLDPGTSKTTMPSSLRLDRSDRASAPIPGKPPSDGPESSDGRGSMAKPLTETSPGQLR